jgi:tetratricopeptide (TPR) repeat protein
VAIVVDLLQQIQDLYDSGRYLSAFRAGEELGPLADWPSTRGQVLAGRLAANLGGERLARVLHFRAWRRERTEPRACYFYVWSKLVRRGPLAAWQTLERLGDVDGNDDRERGEWFALRAYLLGHLRDYDTAERWMERAFRVGGEDHAWLWVERSTLFELEDKFEDALAAARKSLDVRAWYRPGVQHAAHLLTVLGRDRDAVDLLEEAADHLESGDILMQLGKLYVELAEYDKALDAAQRSRPFLPILEKDTAARLEHLRAEALYLSGDVEGARQAWALCDTPYQKRLLEKLATAGPDARRVSLKVPFVRQHHDTCAPATLAALVDYWERPTDHLDLAANICYDGTPAYSERNWADTHGFATREFRATLESATALLDRGVPFTLTTVEPASAHLQGVVGYDSRLGTFLVREPSYRHVVEYGAAELIERYRSTGPRGMALVPEEKASLLEGLDLPDAALCDGYYRMQLALSRHDREEAVRELNSLRETDAGHRLTATACWVLACYDADREGQLAALDTLLALFPDDQVATLAKVNCLRDLERRPPRLALLRQVAADPKFDPVFARQLAQELADDAREHEETKRLLRRVLRHRWRDGAALWQWAGALWDADRREEALTYYRVAACIEDKNEHFAQTYFVASRHFRRAAEVIDFLRGRYARFGGRSGYPARTLSWALEQLERTAESAALLDEAIDRRPEDGDLLLYAADFHARYGQHDSARQLLERARSLAHRQAWLRTAADLARMRGELRESLGHWRQVVADQPLAVDAHAACAARIDEVEGRSAAVAHLRSAARRFPHNYAIQQHLVIWLREEGVEEYVAAARELIAIHPDDGWSHRELALAHLRQRDFPAALAAAETAMRLEPSNPNSHGVLGDALAESGRVEESRAAYRAAIRLSADAEVAIERLMGLADTPSQRRSELEFIRRELERQVTFGDGILAWREHAVATLDAFELLKVLREALAARPDLWHAWVAVVRQLVSLGQADEAVRLGRQAAERFPLLPALWIELATALRLARDESGEIEALERALHINPAFGRAVGALCDALERRGEIARAREVAERALAHAPSDVRLLARVAELQWSLQNRDAAFELMQRALLLLPGYEPGWEVLQRWSHESNQPQLVVEAARDMSQRRPGERQTWLILAQVLAGDGKLEEAVQAVERGLALRPRWLDGHDLRVRLLSEAGRHEEAHAACRPPVYGGDVPVELRGRAAWVLAQQSRRDEAIAAMHEVLAESPQYLWGRIQLVEWTHAGAENRPEEFLNAAEALVCVAPNLAMAHGYLGDAQQRNGKTLAARASWLRAVEIDPKYSYAATALFDLEIDRGAWHEAKAVLPALRASLPPGEALCNEMRLACKLGERERAAEVLNELCANSPLEDQFLAYAIRQMYEAKLANGALDVLGKFMGDPNVPPVIAANWFRLLLQLGQWDRCHNELEALHGRQPAWSAAAVEVVDTIVEQWRRSDFRWFVEDNPERYREDDAAWASVGRALNEFGRYRDAENWTADWASRDVPPWVYSNLAVTMFVRARFDELTRVVQRGLSLRPDHTRSLLETWGAIDALMRRDAEGAVAFVDGVAAGFPGNFKSAGVGPGYEGLFRLVDAAARLAREPGKGLFAYWRGKRVVNRVAWAQLANCDDWIIVRLLHAESLARLAEMRGCRWTAAWRRFIARFRRWHLY